MRRFYMRDITEILGIQPPKLQQWVERGFVSPSIERASGTGTRNIWSIGDMVRLAAFDTLVRSDISRAEASELVYPKNAYFIHSMCNQSPYFANVTDSYFYATWLEGQKSYLFALWAVGRKPECAALIADEDLDEYQVKNMIIESLGMKKSIYREIWLNIDNLLNELHRRS